MPTRRMMDMGVRPYVRCAFIVLAVVLALPAREARAQLSDFNVCDPDAMVACSATRTGCCYKDFGPGTIIIPMDRCHQALTTSPGNKYSVPTAANSFCANPSPVSGGFDQGMTQAYGLVYRLMQNNIPVYWTLNPTKDAPALTFDEAPLAAQTYTDRDVDFWVLSTGASPPVLGGTLSACGAGCTPPVLRLNTATLAPVAGSYTMRQFPLRGAAFVIAPEDRARFVAFRRRVGEFAGFTGNARYDFSAVELYEIQAGASVRFLDYRAAGPAYPGVQGGSSAPVHITLSGDAPRLARHTPAAVSTLWLQLAKLDEPAAYPACLTGDFNPSTAVYCDVSNSNIQAGNLVTGAFDWVWIDNWEQYGVDGIPCSDASEQTQMDKIREFLTAVPGVRQGGHVMAMDDTIYAIEKCDGKQLLGNTTNGLTSYNTRPLEKLIIRYPTNIFTQWADVPLYLADSDNLARSTTKWAYFNNGSDGAEVSSGYQALGTLVRLITEESAASGANPQCLYHKPTSTCDIYAPNQGADRFDVASYARFLDDVDNGLVFYMGGRNVVQNPNTAHLRLVLNSFLALPTGTRAPDADPVQEVSRSAPIVASLGGIPVQFQGTYAVSDPAPPVTRFDSIADANRFEFPYTTGHLRAIDASQLDATGSNFEDATTIFDAADGIPTPNDNGCGSPFTSGCRTVFTTITTGRNPERVFLTRGNAALLQPLLGSSLNQTATEVLISRILAGYSSGAGGRVPKLGGVDRSTVAVIEASPLARAPAGARPTMAYFGALDGMLHAVCVDAVGPCDQPGRELWAYIPRNQLPSLRLNTQRVDGTPKVADVFDDFNGDGAREWKTILTFQTGSGDSGFAGREPSVIAIDVSDPGSPTVLWEVATPSVRGSVELGVGLTLAMGPVREGLTTKNYTFIQTNNGGIGGAGFSVRAIHTVTGQVAWTFDHVYPAARSSANPPVPATGIPGGIAALSRDDNGAVTHLTVGSLYGDLWLLDATTGTSVYGAATPLFRFSTDHHPIGAPPTIFKKNGKYHAIVVSGGYADPVGSSWAPSTERQYAVAVSLDTPLGAAPLNETGSDSANRPFVIDLGVGNRASAQAIVAGNELFIVTDSSDVNASTYGLDGPTGLLSRYSLDSGGQVGPSVVIAGGAASVDVLSGVVYSGSGRQAQRTDVSATFDAAGEAAEISFVSSTGARLWLRVE